MSGKPSARRAWRVLVPVTALGAGLLFATSASTSQGTDIRAGRLSQLTDLVESKRKAVAASEKTAQALRAQVAVAAAAAATGTNTVSAEQARNAQVTAAAGLTAVTGPGLNVSLDDAPRPPAGRPLASKNPDDLVVHQQDVQSVVNALWAGGADAMTIMGERVVATSTIRCVGNTLLVQGALVGPPFIVTAIGDQARMRAALELEPGVALLLKYVDQFGVRYTVSGRSSVRVPAYSGPLTLPNVRPAVR